MRYTVVYDQTARNYGAYVPHLPIVVVTGRTLAELSANAHDANRFHLRGTPAADEPVEVDLIHVSDYQGDIVTLNDERLPAKPTVASPSAHRVVRGDARDLTWLADESVHLVVTSPPYFDLKQYAAEAPGQLGEIHDYERFLDELDIVWRECRRVLVPGGRVCCVVGAVTISRRAAGRHYVLPLPSDIQVRSRGLGLDNLTPIIWHKVSNIALEASISSRFLGKPNLPNGVIKNDFETIVMLRKPGGYRQPTPEMEAASRIDNAEYFKWFAPIWSDITGASTRDHPAPFPVTLAYRLVRMFSFVGDTVLDPFVGTGTTTRAAMLAGRNSIGVEIEPRYIDLIRQRFIARPFGVEVTFETAPVSLVG